MITQLFNLILNIVAHIFRRGSGFFKLLFVIDDFFRVFTMTLLIPIFFRWLNFSNTLVTAGVILGLVIDIHDFISEYGVGKVDVGEIFSTKKK